MLFGENCIIMLVDFSEKMLKIALMGKEEQILDHMYFWLNCLKNGAAGGNYGHF